MLAPLLTLVVAAAQTDAAGTHEFEVLVLGTLHAPLQFHRPDYTPAHVEAVLRVADADVIGVESNPTWFAEGRFYPVTYEAQGIAVPFAEARGTPVVGIDWTDREGWDRIVVEQRERQRASLAAEAASGPLTLERYGHLRGDLEAERRAFLAGPEVGFARMNGLDGDARSSTSPWPGKPSDPGWGGRRNQGIYRYCLEAMADRRGQRLVVVIGGAHKDALDGLFGATPGVRVLQLGEDVEAPTEDAIDRAWTARHLVVTLGHRLDGYLAYLTPGLNDLDRTAELVERLSELSGAASVVNYFLARLHHENGDFEAALGILDGLQGLFDAPPLYPFPMNNWRMRYGWDEAIQLERGRALLALGRTDEAHEALAGLVERLPAVPDLVDSGDVRDAFADAGFEAGESGVNAMRGWGCADVMAGNLRAESDEDRIQGERSLRIDVLRARAAGLASLTQRIDIDPSTRRRGPVQVSVAARAVKIDALQLVAYLKHRDDGSLIVLGSTEVRLSASGWTRCSLEFDAPEEVSSVTIFLYFEAAEDGRIWFDDARSFQVPIRSTPEEWVPRTLAREFPRTLLAGD